MKKSRWARWKQTRVVTSRGEVTEVGHVSGGATRTLPYKEGGTWNIEDRHSRLAGGVFAHVCQRLRRYIHTCRVRVLIIYHHRACIRVLPFAHHPLGTSPACVACISIQGIPLSLARKQKMWTRGTIDDLMFSHREKCPSTFSDIT